MGMLVVGYGYPAAVLFGPSGERPRDGGLLVETRRQVLLWNELQAGLVSAQLDRFGLVEGYLALLFLHLSPGEIRLFDGLVDVGVLHRGRLGSWPHN